MLQRVYGTAWASQEDLDAYLWRREEAKKRDHRRLGVQLDLFSFHDVAPGSAFWHPKGQMIWRTLEGAMRELQAKRGYQEVSTPIVVSRTAVAPVGSLGAVHATTCSSIESENQTFQPQADELPGVDVHLSRATCGRTATCRCGSANSVGSTATSGPAP